LATPALVQKLTSSVEQALCSFPSLLTALAKFSTGRLCFLTFQAAGAFSLAICSLLAKAVNIFHERNHSRCPLQLKT
jgi:hypothetical protein